jgi:hypothetical protein
LSTRFGAFSPEKIVRVNVTTFAKNFYWYGEAPGIAGNAFSLPVVMVYSLSEGRNNRVDGLVKNPKPVTPAEAGVQNCLNILDACFRRNDEID